MGHRGEVELFCEVLDLAIEDLKIPPLPFDKCTKPEQRSKNFAFCSAQAFIFWDNQYRDDGLAAINLDLKLLQDYVRKEYPHVDTYY